MLNLVSITSQGQLTIPKSIRKQFGISGSTKATIKKVGSSIIVEPRNDFWSLGGSLGSTIKATDEDLRKARDNFQKVWPRKI